MGKRKANRCFTEDAADILARSVLLIGCDDFTPESIRVIKVAIVSTATNCCGGSVTDKIAGVLSLAEDWGYMFQC